MRKIPTLFKRDPDDMRHVLPEVTPGCEWVLAGEGVATRKYDGTCVRFDGHSWWARREVKRGKQPPPMFAEVEHDGITGKTVGWEPAEQSGFAKWLSEARATGSWEPGTYELCGPKVNGNPEGFSEHTLIRHADAERLPVLDHPTGYDDLRADFVIVVDPWEGIVWHHPDGRMAKLKRRDFPR